MEATIRNMRAIYPADKTVEQADGSTVIVCVAKPFAYSPYTDERYSANPGDYWTMGDDEALTDSEGNVMVLAFERTSIEEAEAIREKTRQVARAWASLYQSRGFPAVAS